MIENTQHIEFEILAYRYLLNEATELEAEQLISWIEGDPKLAADFIQMKTDLFGIKNELSSTPYHPDQAFAQFLSKTDDVAPAAPVVYKMPLYKKVMQYAALMLLALGIWVLLKNDKVEQTSFATLNDTSYIQLPDYSEVWINKHSIVKYPLAFAENARNIAFTGEAYFHITRNEQAPFSIETDALRITVLGTAFNVLALPNQDNSTVAVTEGKVKVETLDGSQTIILVKGEQVNYSKNNNLLVKVTADVSNALAWQTGILKFNETPLYDVVLLLNKQYNANIQLDNEQLNNCKLSATYDNLSINDVLHLLSITFNLEVVAENDTYLLKGKGCL